MLHFSGILVRPRLLGIAGNMTASGMAQPLVPESSPAVAPSFWFVYLAFCFPAFAGFLFGFDIGGASGAVDSLANLYNTTHGTELSTLETSVLTSASLFGATCGSVLVFWIGEPLGRRRE